MVTIKSGKRNDMIYLNKIITQFSIHRGDFEILDLQANDQLIL